MVAKTTIGSRIVVELPFKGVTDNKPQYVRMKGPVAKLLGFPIKNTSDLTYDVKIKEKDGKTPVQGTQTVKRPVTPGYRQRSFKVTFLEEKALKLNTKKFKSVSFPITPSVSVWEVIKYFETGAGKGLKVITLTTDTGKVHPINSGQLD